MLSVVLFHTRQAKAYRTSYIFRAWPSLRVDGRFRIGVSAAEKRNFEQNSERLLTAPLESLSFNRSWFTDEQYQAALQNQI
jgi:hypothetical protein